MTLQLGFVEPPFLPLYTCGTLLEQGVFRYYADLAVIGSWPLACILVPLPPSLSLLPFKLGPEAQPSKSEILEMPATQQVDSVTASTSELCALRRRPKAQQPLASLC